MTEITLPNGFTPRPYQLKAMGYYDNGGKRGVWVWPRRAGKDLTFIHQSMKEAHARPGTYYHLLPNHTQARKVVWDGISNDGKRVLDVAIPAVLRSGENATEMKITLKCGSIWQLVGADYFDTIMGTNPFGLVFSEAALTDPRAWSYFRPILANNGGWASFISTPRGYNWFYDLLELAKSNSSWGWSHLSTTDTKHIPSDVLAQEKAEMPDELYRQEYGCDFSAANIGAILGRYMERAEIEGRITDDVCYLPEGDAIEISSDIGFRDTASWWFWQADATGFTLIDYDEDSGMDADDWIERLKKKRYHIGKIWLPHDSRVKTFQSKHSAMERFLRAFGQDRIGVVPSTKIPDRINAGRVVINKCRFARTACKVGLAGLRAWSFEYDEERKTFSATPRHDFASHPSDAYTYGCQIMRKRVSAEEKKIEIPRSAETMTLDDWWAVREEGISMERRI